jgi:hypothetical protein
VRREEVLMGFGRIGYFSRMEIMCIGNHKVWFFLGRGGLIAGDIKCWVLVAHMDADLGLVLLLCLVRFVFILFLFVLP